MSTSETTPRQRRPSRSSSKRTFNPFAGRTKPGLAVDTSFACFPAQVPQQVFPYESKPQELSFVSINDAKEARKKRRGSLKQQFGNNRHPDRPSAQRSVSEVQQKSAVADERPAYGRSRTAVVPYSGSDVSSQHAPLHRRIKGLRPSPLNLTHDVSPSDRAITIGITVPSEAVTDHTDSPESVRRAQYLGRDGKEVQTPTIVITPAKEDFGLAESPEEIRHYGRPTSSIYSRYTNCAPNRTGHGTTPPVPPLPLFVGKKASKEPAKTTAEIDIPKGRARDNALSVCTLFEEDDSAHLQPRSAKRLTSQSHLPTPRRSRGWWNVVTSPFSAGSMSQAFFWRSPSPLDNDEDRQRMLDDASEMGTTDSHAGVIFTNRALDDDELRSALPQSTGSRRPSMPKRSDTAPGALDANARPLNIYRTPSQGLAATYYDRSRNFPSMIMDVDTLERSRGSLDGWSPSQSVAHSATSRSHHTSALGMDDNELNPQTEPVKAGEDPADRTSRDVLVTPVEASGHGVDEQTRSIGGAEDTNPFADAQESAPEATGTDRAPPHNISSTPAEDELYETTPPRPPNSRKVTEATLLSHFSPLTPTPVVEDAHIGTYMGPHSNNGELRQIEVSSTKLPSPPDPPQVHANDAHAMVNPPPGERNMGDYSEKAPFRPVIHARNDSSGSLGLGITDGEKELYPPPKAFLERPRLGTDRFGQLTVRSFEGRKPSRPWYRRFFWLLVSFGAASLLVLVVLLVMFVPQAQSGAPVQAEWLNLTGFPPLPTGIATVIQPNTAQEVGGCVSPSAIWSCAAPSSQQTDAGPDFRVEIRFRNGTVPKNETQLARRSGQTAEASALVRRDSWGGYRANSAAPGKDDQVFLGQYTDNVSTPYNGEQTPFYISLLDPADLTGHASRLAKRQNNPYPYPNIADSNSTMNATTIAAEAIPRPALRGNGEPADTELYPYAEAQPLRLYNRGEDNEHYGFYTYFDRSILISGSPSNGSDDGGLGNSITSDVPLTNASAVCTWSQTRLRVQIWTRRGNVADLSDTIPLSGLPAANGTANNMQAPGSFPYSVTVTLDRHGGEAKKKGVYCYGLDKNKHVDGNLKAWISEDRGFGGSVVNPAAVPTSNGTTLAKRDDAGKHYGGIDGGNGGCACQWQNWK